MGKCPQLVSGSLVQFLSTFRVGTTFISYFVCVFDFSKSIPKEMPILKYFYLPM